MKSTQLLAKEETLSLAQLKHLFIYNPGAGVFIRRVRRANRKVGEIAGWPHSTGYRAITIDGRNYLVHRLVWFWETGEWPPHEIDHRNGNRADNRFSNLREATHAQNLRNGKHRKNNTSGFKGVWWSKQKGKWQAGIKTNGRQKHLGFFINVEAAAAAYAEGSKKYHGVFGRLA